MNRTQQLFLQNTGEALDLNQLTVSVVGFGYIGTCIGALLAASGIKVFGIDTNLDIVNEINNGTTSIEEPELQNHIAAAHKLEKLEACTEFGPIATSDIVIVTVGTPLDGSMAPDIDHMKSACVSIGKHLTAGSVVIIKSTLPPLSTMGWLKDALEDSSHLVAGEQFGLVFCPERISEGRAIPELKSIPVVVGGIDAKSSEIAAAFWNQAFNVETVIVGSPTTAELVKLADNQWIDLNIALANEIALLSDKLKIDALEVIKASNSLSKGQHYVNILAPSMGVGGYCLTKDPWFFHQIGQENNLEIQTPLYSRAVNDRMPEFSFQMIVDCLEQSRLELKNARVAVLGLAFKNDTGDVRSTPVEPFLKLLRQSGCSITVYDPLVSRENVEKITDAPIGKDIYSTVEGADLIACMAAHQSFKDTSLNTIKRLTQKTCWFFDGRHGFDPEIVRQAGFLYTGIGRRFLGESN